MTRNFWQRLWPVLTFGWDSRRRHAIFVLLVLVLATMAALQWSAKTLDSRWAIGDRIATMVTLAVAIAVWFGEIREEWERRLPRKLFAFFLYRNKPIAACLGAALSGEHDARQLGQQIGLQMYPGDEKFLAFDITRIEQQELQTVVNQAGKNDAYKPIRIVFHLTNEEQVAKFGLKPDNVLLWIAGHAEKMQLAATDPRCEFETDRLSDVVIQQLR